MKTKLLFVTLVILANLKVVAQPMEGLWLVEEVLVGTERMTPTAKWFNFFSDSTYTSGNGWLQNGSGSWSFNQQEQSLTLLNEDSIEDPYGPFIVHFLDSIMVWNRKENGDKVHVQVKQIEQLPRAPWDELVGNWNLKTDSMNIKEDSTTSLRQIYFRWDRAYRAHNLKGERGRGYWYVHPHRNRLSIWSENLSVQKVYDFVLQDSVLKLRSKGKSVLIYEKSPD
jgi:hypothetical protein